MKEICNQWNKEMKSMRWERRLMIIAIVSLAGVRLFGV